MSAAVEQIARAVLYEGYLLYPYRHSSLKNQQRWNFGVLYPPAWAAQQTGPDRTYLHMECVAIADAECRIRASLRFLHVIAVETCDREWQEAEERQMTTEEIRLADIAKQPHAEDLEFEGRVVATDAVRRRSRKVQARIELSATLVRENVYRLAVRVSNISGSAIADRDAALAESLASAHVVIAIRNGRLISQIDPPEDLRDAVAECQNTGVWPVLVGESRGADVMLGSPIILYDYPQIAPESGGDLFDGTEIDEILTLRILTLTDDEKAELRQSDERARRILDRLESAPQDHLLELHGAIRAMREAGELNGGARTNRAALNKGDRVRLKPRKRADPFDMLLEGRIAIVDAVEEDFENRIHLAVVLEDDPGRDLGEMRQAGHRFFYALDEVEPVASGV